MVARTKKSNPTLPARKPMDLTKVKIPEITVFDPYRVKPLEDQIRERFFGIKELAGSIEEVGQVTPVIVVRLRGNREFDAKLIDGERRLRACRHAEKPVLAYIWDGVTDIEQIYALSVAANFGRQAHDCIEISKAIVRFKKNGKTKEQIARIFGKSSGWVDQHHSLQKLHPTVQTWLIPTAKKSHHNGKAPSKSDEMHSLGSKKIRAPLTFSLALRLISLPPELQIKAGKEIIGRKMSLVEARRYVLSIGRRTGNVGHNRRSPADRRNALNSMIIKNRHIFGTYTDMKESDFKEMFGGATKGDVDRTTRALEKLSEEVIFLATCINEHSGVIR